LSESQSQLSRHCRMASRCYLCQNLGRVPA